MVIVVGKRWYNINRTTCLGKKQYKYNYCGERKCDYCSKCNCDIMIKVKKERFTKKGIKEIGITNYKDIKYVCYRCFLRLNLRGFYESPLYSSPEKGGK